MIGATAPAFEELLAAARRLLTRAGIEPGELYAAWPAHCAECGCTRLDVRAGAALDDADPERAICCEATL